TFLQVLLDDVHILADGGDDAFVVQLDADADDSLVLLQMRQQAAVATAQVEHAAARLDPAGDAHQVGAEFAAAANGKVHASTPVTWLRSGRPSLAAIRS